MSWERNEGVNAPVKTDPFLVFFYLTNAQLGNEIKSCFYFFHEPTFPAPDDFTALSNRSNVYSQTGRFEEALKDADQVIRLRPDWPKVPFDI